MAIRTEITDIMRMLALFQIQSNCEMFQYL